MAAATRTPATGIRAYAPIDGFIADINGSPVNFHRNMFVSERWLEEHPEISHLFKPLAFHYDVEDASANPGRARGE